MGWICVCLCAVSSCRLVCMQKLYHLTHTCIKGLWIIKQKCISFVIWSKKLWSFLHSGTMSLFFSVYLALRSVEILVLRETSCLVSYHSDMMVCVVSALTCEFPFGRELCPCKRDRDWRWCPQGQIALINSLCTWLRPRGKQICFLWGHVATGSLQLVAVIALCTTAVKSACDGFLKSSLRS